MVATRKTTERISQEMNATSGGLLDDMKEYRAETENSLKEFRQDYSMFREQAGGEMNKLVNHYFTQAIKPKYLVEWLTVHRSIILVDLQLDAQNSYLFTYN